MADAAGDRPSLKADQNASDTRRAVVVLTLKLMLFLLLPMISAAIVAWIVLG